MYIQNKHKKQKPKNKPGATVLKEGFENHCQWVYELRYSGGNHKRSTVMYIINVNSNLMMI